MKNNVRLKIMDRLLNSVRMSDIDNLVVQLVLEAQKFKEGRIRGSRQGASTGLCPQLAKPKSQPSALETRMAAEPDLAVFPKCGIRMGCF